MFRSTVGVAPMSLIIGGDQLGSGNKSPMWGRSFHEIKAQSRKNIQFSWVSVGSLLYLTLMLDLWTDVYINIKTICGAMDGLV